MGVVGDVRHAGLAASALPMYYGPVLSRAEEMTFIVRAVSDPEPLLPSIREEVRKLDPDLAAFGVEPMDRKVAASISQPRFNLTLLAAFAPRRSRASAAVGIYGLARYSVSQRTSELGLRIALGATRGEDLRMVLLEGLKTAGLGLALGLIASLALARALASVPGLLHGVSAMDFPTYAGVVAVLSAVVVVASLAPASRASRVPPIEALRYE